MSRPTFYLDPTTNMTTPKNSPGRFESVQDAGASSLDRPPVPSHIYYLSCYRSIHPSIYPSIDISFFPSIYLSLSLSPSVCLSLSAYTSHESLLYSTLPYTTVLYYSTCIILYSTMQNIYMYIRTYTHTYTHIPTYIHTYIHTYVYMYVHYL